MLFGEYARLLESQRREAVNRVEMHIFDNVPHQYQNVTRERQLQDVNRVFECLSDNLKLLEEGVLQTVAAGALSAKQL